MKIGLKNYLFSRLYESNFQILSLYNRVVITVSNIQEGDDQEEIYINLVSLH